MVPLPWAALGLATAGLLVLAMPWRRSTGIGAPVSRGLTAAQVAAETARLVQTARADPTAQAAARAAALRAWNARRTYAQAAAATGVPWEWIAAVNTLEGGGGFDRHLGEGSPLTAVPRHRTTSPPPPGNPPWPWVDATVHYLRHQRMDRWPDWSLAGQLAAAERWNGMGYRNMGRASPYVWGGTQHAVRGRYVADGLFDPAAVTVRPGAFLVLRELAKLTGTGK